LRAPASLRVLCPGGQPDQPREGAPEGRAGRRYGLRPGSAREHTPWRGFRVVLHAAMMSYGSARSQVVAGRSGRKGRRAGEILL